MWLLRRKQLHLLSPFRGGLRAPRWWLGGGDPPRRKRNTTGGCGIPLLVWGNGLSGFALAARFVLCGGWCQGADERRAGESLGVFAGSLWAR